MYNSSNQLASEVTAASPIERSCSQILAAISDLNAAKDRVFSKTRKVRADMPTCPSADCKESVGACEMEEFLCLVRSQIDSITSELKDLASSIQL